jgi:hypothetical protein
MIFKTARFPADELLPGAALIFASDGYPAGLLNWLKPIASEKYGSSAGLVAGTVQQLLKTLKPELHSRLVFVQLHEKLEMSAVYELWLDDDALLCSAYWANPINWSYEGFPGNSKLLWSGRLADADVPALQRKYEMMTI